MDRLVTVALALAAAAPAAAEPPRHQLRERESFAIPMLGVTYLAW